MRTRGVKTTDTNLLFSPPLLVDCCVFDTCLPWRKGRTLTKSAPAPWSSSRLSCFTKKGTVSAFAKQGADLHSRRSSSHMGQGTLRVMICRRWRCGHFRCYYNGYKPQFLQRIFGHCWTVKFVFHFFEKNEETPDTNGRVNELFYSVIFGGHP